MEATIRHPKIKYSFIYTNLKKWLKSNQDKFPTRPQISKLRRDSLSLTFSRVKNIVVNFNKYGMVEVWGWRDGEGFSEDFDILTEFDLSEEKNSKGYYCGLCLTREYYQDREIMWEKHIYELLLKWAIENIKPDKHLCIFETESKGALWAKILTTEDLKTMKDEKLLVFCKPVITAPNEK